MRTSSPSTATPTGSSRSASPTSPPARADAVRARKRPPKARVVTTIESVEPATEAVRARYEQHSAGDVAQAIAAADAAFRIWREVPIADRAEPMRALARILRERKDRYARLITTEMGKPIGEALAEIEKCALTCDFYADRAAEFLADERVQTNARESFLAFEPLGVVLAVMPWNYPFWQVI